MLIREKLIEVTKRYHFSPIIFLRRKTNGDKIGTNHVGKNVNCHSFLGMQSDNKYENLRYLFDLVIPNLNDYPKQIFPQVCKKNYYRITDKN